jgi:hypothetical protein
MQFTTVFCCCLGEIDLAFVSEFGNKAGSKDISAEDLHVSW